MTFNQMKYFITLAECLSFTEAARCLFITQPALSRQILAMEDELGMQLFVRDKKQLKLTPAGSVLYNRFPAFMEQYTGIINEAKKASQGFSGKLRIGFLDIYDVSELFPAILEQFQHRYPEIQITMERGAIGELPHRLHEDQLDIVLTYAFSLFDQPNLVTVDIQKYESMIMLNANHPLADKEDLMLADLKEDLFVLLAADICEEGDRYLRSLFAKSNVHPNIMTVNKMEDILLWVQTRNAVAITSNKTTEGQNSTIVLRPIRMEEAKNHDITLAWRKNNYNPAIPLFMELVEKQLTHGEQNE